MGYFSVDVGGNPITTVSGSNSDPVLLFDQNDNNDVRGLRSVQDICPGCAGQATQQGATPAHIDM